MKTRLLLLLLTLSLLFTASCNQGNPPDTSETTPTTDTTKLEEPPYQEPPKPSPRLTIEASNLLEYNEKISNSESELINGEGGYQHQFIHLDTLRKKYSLQLAYGSNIKFTLEEYETYTIYYYRLDDPYISKTPSVSIYVKQYKEYNESLDQPFTGERGIDKKIDIASNDLLSFPVKITETAEMIPLTSLATQHFYYLLQPNIRYYYKGSYYHEKAFLSDICARFDGTIEISIRISSDDDYKYNKQKLISALANKETAIATLNELIKPIEKSEMGT